MSAAVPAFLGDIPEHLRDPRDARFHILPVPYDATSTWKKGADLGAEAIIEASAEMELYDIQTASEPYMLGAATHAPIVCADEPEAMCDLVEAGVGASLDGGHTPIVLGGEHSVSIGAIRAAGARFENLTTLQIDAHSDTRETYLGSKCNHACVMARAREVSHIVQVGIRSMDAQEMPALDPARVLFAHEIVGGSGASEDEGLISRVCDLLTPEVYVTVDLDALDPGIMPATGTPEPGGLSWGQVNQLLDAVTGRSRVVACDVVELCPREDLWACDFLAARLVYRMMAMIGRS